MKSKARGEKMARISTSLRVDEDAKKAATKIFKEYGLSFSDGVNIFLHQVSLTKGFPFEIRLPNKKTMKAIGELNKREGKSFDNVDDLFTDLEDK